MLVLPLFLFAMLNMYAAINQIAIHVRLEGAMSDVGRQMAAGAYGYQQLSEEYESMKSGVVDFFVSEGYAKQEVVSRAGHSFLDSVGIRGGAGGISFLQSKIVSEDYIDLLATYNTQALFVPGFSGFQMANRVYLKCWTGYDNTQNEQSEESNEQIVYVTETGTVYHLTRECTHIKLSIREIEERGISEARNQNGGKYYPCELCGGNGELIYITSEGDRYHSSLNCSGLKRTVKAIPISEVGERGLCSRCAGN